MKRSALSAKSNVAAVANHSLCPVVTTGLAMPGFTALERRPALLLRSLLMLIACLPFMVQASDEVVHFDDPAHKQVYQAMLKEYRCLKCQNQNLWDSNASLAGDLRREIRSQIVDGKTKAEIDEYLVARYGEFVLYRPRFSAKTAVLWIGPFVLLFIGLASILLMARKKGCAEATVPAQLPDVHSDDKLAKARDLLGK